MLSLGEALDMIRHNKLRSFLTMLGMNIGVGAIIAVISLGLMAREDIMGEVDDIGSAIIWVEPNYSIYRHWSDTARMEMEDYRNLENLLKKAAIVPYINGNEEMRYGGYSSSAQIRGVTGNYDEVFPYELARGRFFNERDNRLSNPVAVIGSRVAGKWFGESDPVGKEIQLGNDFFRVVGVMEERAQGLMSDGTGDQTVYLPINSYSRLHQDEYNRPPTLDLLIIRAPDTDSVSEISRITSNYFFAKYGEYRRQPRFTINQARQEIAQFNKIFNIITTVVSMIAGISLLVSGIGIMNIMLMAITERTREIGIRKALGARREDILQQFLIEAIIICLLGGGIGVLFGMLISWLVALTQNWPFGVPFYSVTGGIGVSILIGLFFGIYPAWRAAALPPIQALGRE